MFHLDRPHAVAASVTAATKKALFQTLATMAARAHALDATALVEALTERERTGSTGFGGGTAIPHARATALPEVVGVFARLSTPVDYGAIDGLPVDLVLMLASPAESGARHLRALAWASRMLRDRASVAKLRSAASEDALVALLTGEEARDAA